MKRLIVFIFICAVLAMPFETVMAGNTQSTLESDMQAVFPEMFSVDEDFPS